MAGYYHEVLECVKNPDAVYKGNYGELIGIKEIQEGRHIVAVYKELTSEDGVVITSFTTKKKQFERRRKLWEK